MNGRHCVLQDAEYEQLGKLARQQEQLNEPARAQENLVGPARDDEQPAEPEREEGQVSDSEEASQIQAELVDPAEPPEVHHQVRKAAQ